MGLDDYLSSHGSDELLQLASPTIPGQPVPNGETESGVSYRSTSEGLFIEKNLKQGPVLEQLTNFTACIVSPALVSDGMDESRELEIEAKVNGVEKRVIVAADRFDTMG